MDDSVGIIEEIKEERRFHGDVAEGESEDEAERVPRFGTMIWTRLHDHIA